VQKRKLNTDEKIFASLEFDCFRVQLKFAFRIRPFVSVVTLETKLHLCSNIIYNCVYKKKKDKGKKITLWCNATIDMMQKLKQF